MRLATVRRGERPAASVIDGELARPAGAYRDVGELLRDGERGLAAAREPGPGRPFAASDLLRPVLCPGAVVCVGLNYRPHIEEMGIEPPRVPTLFGKLPRALTDPFAPIPKPRDSDQLDYEGELAVVIGRAGRDVAAAEAWEHVAGLSVLDDVSVRDFQTRTPQWFAGKNWQASTPWGPWVEVLDSPPDLEAMELTVRVNGELRQSASLGDLVFGVPELVADISRIFELRPGDVIATGTPGGVGMASDDYLAVGDEVAVEISGLGRLRNRVIAAPG